MNGIHVSVAFMTLVLILACVPGCTDHPAPVRADQSTRGRADQLRADHAGPLDAEPARRLLSLPELWPPLATECDDIAGYPTRSEITNNFVEWLRATDRVSYVHGVILNQDDEIVSIMWNLCAYADRPMLEQFRSLTKLVSFDIVLAAEVRAAAFQWITERPSIRSLGVFHYSATMSDAEFEALQRALPQAHLWRSVISEPQAAHVN